MPKKVYGTGPMNPDIMIVGEAPGKTELQQDKPFVGKAGRELDRLLKNAGIERSRCRVTNVIKEMPDKRSNFVSFGNNVQTSDKYDKYEQMLYKEVQQVDCDVIIALGNVPLYALTRKQKITKRRGSVYDPDRFDKKVVPTVHPSYLLRIKYVPRMAYMKYSAIYDLVKAKDIAEGNYEEPDRNLHLEPSFTEAMSFLNGIDSLTGVDIEVTNEEVDCISFSPSKSESMCIPFLKDRKDYFTAPQEMEIWKKIAEIMESQEIKCVGHNLTFDCSFLLRKLGINSRNLEDTMIAQATILPTFPKKLAYVASIYSKIPFWKDTGKRWEHQVDDITFWRYNALDSLSCRQALPEMIEDLKLQNNYETYKAQRNLVPALMYIGERGIKVDLDGMVENYCENQERLEGLQEELNEMAGRELNPNSPKQLIEYFYEEEGYYTYTKDGSPTTNKEALKRLSRKGADEAPVIIKMRHLNKMASNYYDPDKVSKDGRLRCSFNPVGTPNGRVSSSENIFGKGMNFQNIPYEARKYLIADKACVFYAIDLEQAENRVVAYTAPEPEMIRAFNEGIDIHSKTGALLAEDLSIEEVKQQDEEGIKVDIGDGEHTWRHWGKKANHGLNYGMGYKKFALVNEIPEKESKKIVEKYHSIYPGIRNSYHEWIKNKLYKDRKLTNPFDRTRKFFGPMNNNVYQEAYNYIPQSTVADIINRWAVAEVYHNQKKYKCVQLVNTTHDSITIQMEEGNDRYHRQVLTNLKQSLEQSITWRDKEFSIPIEIEKGKDLCDMEVITL